MSIRDELKKIEEEEKKRVEEQRRKEFEEARKRREQEEMEREAQKRAEEEERRLIEEKKREEKRMEAEQRLISLVNSTDPNLDEPHVYLLKGIYEAHMEQYIIHQGPYPYIGKTFGNSAIVREIRSKKIIMTEREYLIMKELGGFYKLISYNSSLLESSNISKICKLPTPPYDHFIEKEISDYSFEGFESITDVSLAATKKEQRKLELIREKVKFIKNLNESQKNKKAKMRIKGRDEIELNDEQAALCSINYNQDKFILSEELEKEARKIEEARIAEEARRAEEARIAEEERKAEEQRKSEKKGFTFSDIRKALGKVFSREDK